jgi:DUF1009 family protein
MARIGLVAGGGALPAIFAKIARERGDEVVAFGLKGFTSEELAAHVDRIHWLEWGDLKKAMLLLSSERIRKIVMLGKLRKDLLFRKAGLLDDEAKRLLEGAGGKKDYALLNEAAKLLGKLGIEVMDAAVYLKDLLPIKGTLTKREPTEAEWEDIRYGAHVARQLAGFDIGQTVIVKDRTVIALEAAEGTDETIKRAGALTDGGFVVVKVARPEQDMRFDVPLIGIGTVDELIRAGGKALALEEKRTFLIDKDEILKKAGQKGIAITVI